MSITICIKHSVLDIYSGKPGKGIKVELYFISAESRKKLKV